jgi:hypothetical protein
VHGCGAFVSLPISKLASFIGRFKSPKPEVMFAVLLALFAAKKRRSEMRCLDFCPQLYISSAAAGSSFSSNHRFVSAQNYTVLVACVVLLSLSLSQKGAEDLDVWFKSLLQELYVCCAPASLCISINILLCSRVYLNIEMYTYYWQRVELLPVQNRRACWDMCGTSASAVENAMNLDYVSISVLNHAFKSRYISISSGDSILFLKIITSLLSQNSRCSGHVRRFCPFPQLKDQNRRPQGPCFYSNYTHFS